MTAAAAAKRHAARLAKRIGVEDLGPNLEQQIERRPAAWPIDTWLHCRTRRHSHGSTPAAAAAGGQARHCTNQRFANRDCVGFGKQRLEATPIFVIRE